MKPTVTMPHYSEQQIETANSTSLVAFINSHGEQLKKFGAQHLWGKHQVWVRDNRWYTHYDAAGGYAISFVMKYYAMDFQNAVAELLGGGIAVCNTQIVKEKKPMKLVVPKENTTMNRVYAYLMNERFISREVIAFFAHEITLYKDAQYHNCIFVGVDEEGVPKHIHRRGTHGSFKLTESGSKAKYNFRHDGESEWLFVFEAPIDKDGGSQQAFGGIVEECVLTEGCTVHAGHDDGLGYDLCVLFRFRFVGKVVGFLLPQIHILIHEVEQIIAVRLCGVTQVNDCDVVSIVFLCNLTVMSV